MNNKSGVACEEGEYKDFTGIIMWGETESVVENATFVLSDLKFAKAIVFHSGVWENGYWGYGTWESGIWRNGTWKDGVWWCGSWENGNWEDGIWRGGTWKDGTWKNGYWEDGIWKTGYDKNECTRKVNPNNWKDQNE